MQESLVKKNDRCGATLTVRMKSLLVQFDSRTDKNGAVMGRSRHGWEQDLISEVK